MLKDAAGKKLFWTVLIGAHAIYGTIAYLTSDPLLIVILNLAKVSLATMVCIAFGPAFIRMARGEQMDKELWLIFGIFLSWFSSSYQAILSLAWRYFGEPRWLVNSDFISYPLFLTCLAALIHVAVPKVIGNSVPPRKWVSIGAGVGIAVFAGLLTIYWNDIKLTVDRSNEMHDMQPIRPSAFHLV